MGLSIGIVGMPNVGKSTLFNAITNAGAEAQNYPFCTIEPNSGIVPINDPRLFILGEMGQSKEVIPAVIEFTDIAGLVKGASQGEGLGNKFLTHIREVSAIAHVVRCFDDDNITHVDGRIDPASDIETINLELILSDLDLAEKMHGTMHRKMRMVKDLETQQRFALLERIKDALAENIPIRHLELTPEEYTMAINMNFLTIKKMIYVANVSEADVITGNHYTQQVAEIAKKDNDEFAVISARIEEELSQFSKEEKKEFMAEAGIAEAGLDAITRKCFSLLGLQTYLTTGEKESRAWTIKRGDTAPKAAGVIHTDFERGFIRANIVTYDDFIANNGWKGAKEKGLLRQEGKDYVMQDGDIVEFLFNV